MNSKSKLLIGRWLGISLLIVISALTYLPNIGDLTYYKDDWYYVYDGVQAGPDVYYNMFSIDRPIRGPFFAVYYSLFGVQPLPYHIGAYLWRVLGALGALWLFGILWPSKRRIAFIASILFAVYPGYLWWVSGIEYQPMIASLCLQVFSIALTVKAVQATRMASKAVFAAGAVLMGWLYIALVDYAIGMEVFRFLCVYVLVSRRQTAARLRRKISTAIRAWAVNLVIPLGFLFWRAFIFENVRKATDIGLQLAAFFNTPLTTALRWAVQLFQSAVNVAFLAWSAPFYQNFFGMRLRDILIALSIATVSVFIILLADRWLKNGSDDPEDKVNFSKEALWLGGIGTIIGVLPVVLANRSVFFEGFSHYALPASLAGAVLVTGLLYTINFSPARLMALSVLTGFAVLTHYAVSVAAVNEIKMLEKFWWQASWRIPSLRAGTTMAIHYPSSNIGDDGYGVMETANLIYYPERTGTIPVHYNLSAVTVSDLNAQYIMDGRLDRETAYRSHTVNFDFGNILLLSQPTEASCVHVIDGRRPFVSSSDPGNVFLIAPHSKIDNILADGSPAAPPAYAFGPEPEYDWCYYFEKADLAFQRNDWAAAAALGDEAVELGLHPDDLSEWMPFLQTYAILGDEKKVRMAASKINSEPFLRFQACEILNGSDRLGYSLDPQMQAVVSDLFCRGGQNK